jgi:hypothetical protein
MHFKFKNEKIPLEIRFKEAYKLLPKYEIHILGLLVEDNVVKTLTTILTDDLKMLGLWYEFIKDHQAGSFEDLIDELSVEDFKSFKETLWSSIVNFTDPQLRPALVRGREEVERELTKTLKNLKFSSQSSDTVEGQE